MAFRKHLDRLEAQFNKFKATIDGPKDSSAPPIPDRLVGHGQQKIVDSSNQYQQYPSPCYSVNSQVTAGQCWQQQAQGQSGTNPAYPTDSHGHDSIPPPLPSRPQAYQQDQHQPKNNGQFFGTWSHSNQQGYGSPTQNHDLHNQAPFIPERTKPRPLVAELPASPNLALKPNIGAPPGYSKEFAAPYWNPVLSPETTISQYFDFDLGAGGWGNNELQTYTKSPTNSFCTPDKSLVIRCNVQSSHLAERGMYTSARLLSKQRLARRRGYLSATLSAPCAKGIWPAFWLLPEEPFDWPQDGEVDIFEAWNGGHENHSCLHWGNYTDLQDKQKHRVINTHITDITKPHEYGFVWEQPEYPAEGGRFMWYIDGKPVMKAHRPPATKRLECYQILLNVAVGGTVCDGCIPDNGSYDLVVHRLVMSDAPPSGWDHFETEWLTTSVGRTLE